MRRRAWIVSAMVVALACVLAPSASAAKDKTVWLCKPGLADNPCNPGFATTTVAPDGAIGPVDDLMRERKPKTDCFYVYPTVSDDPTPNSDLSIDPEERSVALYQAARYSLHCRVFAPMYRQVTLAALFGGQQLTPDERLTAYNDVVAAWKTYLSKYNHGRGVVLVGHSQGTFVLRQLIHDYVDPRKGVRKRLVSAILLGGNVLVRQGSTKGGDFRHVAACESQKDTGCVIAFSTFNAPVPAETRFGRPTVKLDLTPATGDAVLCNNPAALRGGTAQLRTIYPSEPFAPGTTIGLATQALGMPRPPVSTPWIQSEAYLGACSSADDANVLQTTPVDGAPKLNPIPDSGWGLHLADANIALGNLTNVVARQAKVWSRANR
jgi:hypothetical protein